MSTLAEMLYSLSTDKLLEIQTAIIEAGITREFKSDYRSIFKRLRSQSSGKAKNIYSALSKATPAEMERISDLIIKKAPNEGGEMEVLHED